MKTIIYVGGFRLPDKTASAVRVFQNALLLQSLGYELILLGKLEDSSGEIIHQVTISGILCMDIRKPFSDKSYPDYALSSEVVDAVVSHIGASRVAAVIAYNYPLRGFRSLLSFFSATEIKVIADCTEWYGWEGVGFIRDLIRVLATEIRMRYFVPKAAGVICASRFLASFYGSKKIFIWPFCVQDLSYFEPLVIKRLSSKEKVFTYCGNPGAKIRKDQLNILVQAFYGVLLEGKLFKFNVVGLSENQYLEIFPEDRGLLDALNDKIIFYGRKTRDDSIKILASSHYSVFVRPQNRVSHVGFATKIYEAFCCGVPTITNDTSDNALYIKDAYNGYILEKDGVEGLKAKLREAIELGSADYNAMRVSCLQHNPFEGRHFAVGLQRFIESAIKMEKI